MLQVKNFRAVSRLSFAVLTAGLTLLPARGVAASWTKLKNPAPVPYVGTMMLLTDGTVMIQANYSSQNWLRLTPDSHGSYINGIWTANPIAPMAFPRYYFASQVLPDGRVWLVGGEYTGPFYDANWGSSGQIWDPVTNTWSSIEHYPNEKGGCFPVPVTSNANIKKGSDVITGIYSTDRIVKGWTVSGTGIPSNTTVTSVDSSTEVHISKAATATGSETLQFFGTALSCLGDEPSILISPEKILVGNLLNNSTYIYDIPTNTWEFAADKVYKTESSDEEGWTKLPDGSVLTYDLFQSIAAGNGYAELYHPNKNQWVSISPADGTAHGTLPLLSSPALGYELGPVLRLQDGRVIVIGANQHTALYTPSTNTWQPGPDIIGKLSNPYGSIDHAFFGADDAPAALLPNGHVLLAADAGPNPITLSADTKKDCNIVTVSSTAGLQVYWSVSQENGKASAIPSGTYITSIDSTTQIHISNPATATAKGLGLVFGGLFSLPTELFDFNPKTNTISPVSPPIPDEAVLSTDSSYVTRMLVLPTGQLLFSDITNQLWVYTADGDPNPALWPEVKKVSYDGKGVFTLTGTQLNGQSDASSYGDDVQSDENYPIARLVNSSGEVYYCRTTNWSSTAVDNPSKLETVNFTLNPAIKPGEYQLLVSGAGISSCPFTIKITDAEVNGE
ncbi:MAG: hypothetical protein JOY62_19500 [Acidobacteriaceae bacterium]|nr:hypothetical protein [Acidobacteriaceae bacterium]MBV9782153.1 hypothetical protein [Acidobacteriaceae bacterium]